MLGIYYGCNILTRNYVIETLTKKLLSHIKVTFLELKNTFCCGGRLRSISTLLNNYLSTRILAIAQKNDINELLVFCNWGYASLMRLKYDFAKKSKEKERISELLTRENLEFPNLNAIRITHVIDFLYDLLRKDKIKLTRAFNLKVAVFPGCQAIRPRQIGINAKERINKFEILMHELSFNVVDYPEKESCCGFSLLEYKKDTALTLAGLILSSAKKAGADILVTACPLCLEMLDYHQDEIRTHVREADIPVVHVLQLVGLAIGFSPSEVYLHLNSSTRKLLEKLQ